MARVALVTGGSRGIGAAISVALKAAGYTVVANYAGNDEAAAAFSKETGIPTYKWSVADYEACAAGLAKVQAEVGPIDVLVNNAGITRDAMFHKMTPAQWNLMFLESFRPSTSLRAPKGSRVPWTISAGQPRVSRCAVRSLSG